MSFRGVPSLPPSSPPCPAAAGLRSQHAGVQCPVSTRALVEWLVSPSAVQLVQVPGPQTWRWKRRSPWWGSPFSGAGCSRGDCRVGVDRELPVGPVKLRSHSAGHPLPPAPTKPRRADRSRSFPRQPRRVQGPPAPGCGRAPPSSRQGHLHSWVQRVQFPFCPVLRRTSSEGAVLVCDVSQGARGQGEHQGPRPPTLAELPTLRGSANARPLPLVGHSPAEPRGEVTLGVPL